ncbi:MAG: hypothetical protein Q7T70_11670 [Polaromonas sp.]|nr:hypothetical protein [Polaromonas sp.]
MVINVRTVEETMYERALSNTIAGMSLDDRMALLEKRVGKACDFFRTNPGPLDRRNVTVFAAPEYLFAKDDASHFVTEDEKDSLVKQLKTLSRKFPDVVLFPGTIAWTEKTKPGSKHSKEAKAQRDRVTRNIIFSKRDNTAFNNAQDGPDKFFLARNTCYVMHRGKLALAYDKRDNGNEVNRDTDGANVFFVHGAIDSVFDLEGLSFGLKICAEVGSNLSRLVDIQVVISSSHPVLESHMQLLPDGVCCHADAVLPPAVWQEHEGRYIKPEADARRRGGGPITKNEAGRRIAHALNYQDHPELVPDSQAYAEKVTGMRGRTRYYRVDYTQGGRRRVTFE